MFAKSEDAKKAGWFSRRHKTNDAHLAAREARERKRDTRRNRERGVYVLPSRLRTQLDSIIEAARREGS